MGTSGRAINLSLFDLIVVLLFVVTVRDRAVQVDRVVLTIALAAMALVIVHSAAFLLAGAPHDLAGLARETAKSTAFFLEVLLLTIVMRAGGIRLPSLRILTLLFVILSIQAVALHFQELYAPGSWFLPRNQHMATLAGLIVLAALAYAGGAITRRYLVIGIAALIAVAFLLFNKTYLAVALVMLALLPFIRSEEHRSGSRITMITAFLLFVAFTAMFITGDSLRGFGLFERLDTIGASLGFRMQLWAVAWDATVQGFPTGIGLGQFASCLAAEAAAAEQTLRFVHNTPLAYVAEMGLAGVVLVLAIVALMVRATRQLPLALSAILLVYLGLPMLLHDALGLRMIAIILAAGLAGTLQQVQR